MHSKSNPDRRSRMPAAADTNHDHPAAGGMENLPGEGLVSSSSDVSTHADGPGRHAPEARTTAPEAERPGTTEGRAAAAARGGAKGGLDRMEAPSAQGQTAYAPPTGGTGAPSPGSSGISATSDPNFSAQHAEEEGVPTQDALDAQSASHGKKTVR